MSAKKNPPSSLHKYLSMITNLNNFLKACVGWLGGIQRDIHYHYINKMQVHIGLLMLLQRHRDEVAVVAFCGELACLQAAYPQERAEGPLQLHKAAELMATVMAWLHLKSREFDCRSAACAWPLALPQTTRNYSYAHSWLVFLTACAFTFECPALGYILNDPKIIFSIKIFQHTHTQTAGPPTACHLSDVPKKRMESHTCMWRMPVGESDVSRIWQDSLGTA